VSAQEITTEAVQDSILKQENMSVSSFMPLKKEVE